MPTLDDFFGDTKPPIVPDYVPVVQSSLACEDNSCNGVASEGKYYEGEQTLTYVCPKCERENVIKGIII